MAQKISEVIKNLKAIKEMYGDLDCIYSKDDEGNEHQGINYAPEVGMFTDGEFHTEETEEVGDIEVNAVCIN